MEDAAPVSMQTWHVEVSPVAQGIRIRLPERAVAPIEDLGPQLVRLAGDCDGDLHLDCAGVNYVTSTDLSVLIRLHNRLRAGGRRLVLCNVSPFVHEVLTTTRLHTVFDIIPSCSPPGGG